MAELDHRLLLAQNFAVLNPIQIESSLWQDLPVIPLDPEHLSGTPSQPPMLLDLSAFSAAGRTALLDRCMVHDRHSRKPYFSALLVSDASPDRLASHLSRQLVIEQSDNARAMLRFFDPAVFAHLGWIFDARQMDALLGPVTQWTWRDMSGAWLTVGRGHPEPARIRPTAAQWSTLLRLGLVNRTLRSLQRSTPGLVCNEALARCLDRLLQDARECHGLAADADRQLYATQALRFHRHLHRHPVLAERLARAATGGTSYVDACSDLDDEQLTILATRYPELPPARTSA